MVIPDALFNAESRLPWFKQEPQLKETCPLHKSQNNFFKKKHDSIMSNLPDQILPDYPYIYW